MKINGENIFFSGVISAFAIAIGVAIGWLIESMIKQPIYLVYVGFWIISTLLLYFIYERHLEKKENIE